jgi:hypothetical protein
VQCTFAAAVGQCDSDRPAGHPPVEQPAADACDDLAVPWDAVDEWFEEGRRLVHYPPNPYHRIDCRRTRRRLRVMAHDTVAHIDAYHAAVARELAAG